MKIGIIGAICGFILVCGFILMRESQGPLPQNALSVMTLNVGTFNSSPTDMDAVEKLILKSGVPDILLLQEVPGEGTEVGGQRSEVSEEPEIGSLKSEVRERAGGRTEGKGHGAVGKKLGSLQAHKLAENLQIEFFVFEPYPPGRDGLAILSKYPLKKVKTFIFDGYAALAVEADINGKKLLLCSIHLERVKGIRVTETGIDLTTRAALGLLKKELVEETPRSRSVEELLSWISAQNYEKIIIGGDFNTVPFSTAVRQMNGRFEDALWPSLDYFAGSYNMSPFPVSPRIDYIFHSPALKCLSASIIKESAGDHYPIKALFDP